MIVRGCAQQRENGSAEEHICQHSCEILYKHRINDAIQKSQVKLLPYVVENLPLSQMRNHLLIDRIHIFLFLFLARIECYLFRMRNDP